MRATAPSGSAEYEGKVAWAGELGYGVRPPERGQMFDVPTTTAEGQHDDPEAQARQAAAEAPHDADGHPRS
jgi:NADH-quinone oxidoreductase subunit I